MNTIHKSGATPIEPAGPDSFKAVISTPTIDRQGDIIDPLGIDYSAYMRGGGFLLWGHQYRDLPVARASRVWADKHGLYGEFTWAGHPRALQVREAVADLGIMGVSIGLTILQSEPIGSGVRYTKSEMLEASLTPVPANPQCAAVLRAHGLTLPDDDQLIELKDEPDQDDIVLTLVDDDPTFDLPMSSDELREAVHQAVDEAVAESMIRLTGRLP